MRKIFLAALMGLLGVGQAHAYTSEEMEVKTRTEARLHQQVTSFLSRTLDPDQFRIAETVEVFTSDNPARFPASQPESLQVQDPAAGSWLSEGPQDLNVGIFQAQEYAAAADARKNRAPASLAMPDKIVEIGDVQLYLSFRNDVSDDVVQQLKSSLLKFVEKSFQTKTKIEVTKFTPPEEKKPEPPSVSLLDHLKDFAVPLAAAILILGILAHLFLLKKMPAWNEIEQHKIQLQQLELAKQAAQPQLPAQPDPKLLEAVKPPAITDVGEFRRYQQLKLILAEKLRELNDDLCESLLESWYVEGEQGLRKSVMFAQVWNEVRENPIQMETSKRMIELFRSLSRISYEERNRLMEDVIGEISGAESLGADAFRNRFGFLVTKPIEVIVGAVEALEDNSEKAKLISTLPPEVRNAVLGKLPSATKFELLMSVMGLKAVPRIELDQLASQLRERMPQIQEKAGLSGDVIDVSEAKVEFLETLGSEQEIHFVSEMSRRNPDSREWLKSRFFGISMLPEMSDAALQELLTPLPNEDLGNVLLVYDDPFMDRALKPQPPMKQTIVKDRVTKARQAGEKPNWSQLDRWVGSVRRSIKKNAEKAPPPATRFQNFDESKAKSFEMVGLPELGIGAAMTHVTPVSAGDLSRGDAAPELRQEIFEETVSSAPISEEVIAEDAMAQEALSQEVMASEAIVDSQIAESPLDDAVSIEESVFVSDPAETVEYATAPEQVAAQDPSRVVQAVDPDPELERIIEENNKKKKRSGEGGPDDGSQAA